MNESLPLVYNWPKEISKEIVPLMKYDKQKYFEDISPSFWQWIKTLPEYNRTILYNITSSSMFLDK